MIADKGGNKTFGANNIFISFLSLKGCSINVKIRFIDLNLQKRVRKKESTKDIDFNENPKADPFFELRLKMEEEKAIRL